MSSTRLKRIFSATISFFCTTSPRTPPARDADFAGKVQTLERLDARIPRLLEQDIDTLVVAGDHSTPAVLGNHSWHPVPLMLKSSIYAGDGVGEFTERACAVGSIGRIPAVSVMTLALANAGKLNKFGP